jgi:DnaJ-class molecular chaperone
VVVLLQEAERRFKLIAEAYTVLNDDDRRRIYDQLGHEVRCAPCYLDHVQGNLVYRVYAAYTGYPESWRSAGRLLQGGADRAAASGSKSDISPEDLFNAMFGTYGVHAKPGPPARPLPCPVARSIAHSSAGQC